MSTLAHTSANRAPDCTHTLTGSTGGWMTRGAVQRVYLDGHCCICRARRTGAWSQGVVRECHSALAMQGEAPHAQMRRPGIDLEVDTHAHVAQLE